MFPFHRDSRILFRFAFVTLLTADSVFVEALHLERSACKNDIPTPVHYLKNTDTGGRKGSDSDQNKASTKFDSAKHVPEASMHVAIKNYFENSYSTEATHMKGIRLAESALTENESIEPTQLLWTRAPTKDYPKLSGIDTSDVPNYDSDNFGTLTGTSDCGLESSMSEALLEPIRSTLSWMYKQIDTMTRSVLTSALKSTLGLPSVERLRYLLKNDYLRPYLEYMMPAPLHPVPENYHDDAGGVFLRLLMSHSEGLNILKLIELIAKNVSIERKEGKDPRYNVNVACMLFKGRRFFAMGETPKDSSPTSPRSENINGEKVDIQKKLKRLGSTAISKVNKVTEVSRAVTQKSLRSIVSLAKARKPKDFEDGTAGLFLKVIMTYSQGPLYLDIIRAIANNVRIERKPKEKTQYYIDFLGFASFPGIGPLMADIPGLPGELLRNMTPH